LGLINYDRLFIKGITERIKPLYRLLEKEVKFEWNEAEEKTFEQIKKEWEKDLELSIPEMDKGLLWNVMLQMSVLAQYCYRAKDLAYISRNLTKAERNYGITEREV
jgi:hypothetical protein